MYQFVWKIIFEFLERFTIFGKNVIRKDREINKGLLTFERIDSISLIQSS